MNKETLIDEKIEKIKRKKTRAEERMERKRERWEDGRGRGGISGGLFFIFLGVMFFLTNSGLVSPTIWSYMVQLWPVIFILMGIHAILGHSEAARLIMLVITIYTMALVLGYGLRAIDSPFYYSWNLEAIPGMDLLNQLPINNRY